MTNPFWHKLVRASILANADSYVRVEGARARMERSQESGSRELSIFVCDFSPYSTRQTQGVSPPCAGFFTRRPNFAAQEVRRCGAGAQGAAAIAWMAAAVTEAKRLRAQSLRGLVLVNLDSDASVGLRWRARITVPTEDNLEVFRPLFLRINSPPDYIEQVFFSDVRLAALDECQGAWRPVVDEPVSLHQGGDE